MPANWCKALYMCVCEIDVGDEVNEMADQQQQPAGTNDDRTDVDATLAAGSASCDHHASSSPDDTPTPTDDNTNRHQPDDDGDDSEMDDDAAAAAAADNYYTGSRPPGSVIYLSLELQSVERKESGVETFWYRLTQVHMDSWL